MNAGRLKSSDNNLKASTHPPTLAAAPAVRGTGLNRASEAYSLPGIVGNLALQRLLNAGEIKAKLNISQPSDSDEQEADRIAERVVSSKPVGTIQRKCDACSSGTTCTQCDEEKIIQPKEIPGHSPSITPSSASQIASLRSGGQPLPSSVRNFFEPRFGLDFSSVRVHTTTQAEESAVQIGAQAFTAGSHIAFGAGKYAPETPAGQRLLAHELTHVVQKSQRTDDNKIHRQAQHDLTRRTATLETVEALSDEELKSESLRLRKRLSELTLDDPEYVTLRQNLQLLESVAQRVGVDLPAPPSGITTDPKVQDYHYYYQNQTDQLLTTDPVWTRHLLEKLIFRLGQSGTESFINDVEKSLDESDSKVAETRQMFLAYKNALMPVLRDQFNILKKENAQFRDEFERTAKEILRTLLKRSEERIETERVRYGIPEFYEFFGYRPVGTTLADIGLQEAPGLQELKEAAGLLLSMRKDRDAKIGKLKAEIHELKVSDRKAPADDPEKKLIADQLERDSRETELAKRLYEVQKGEIIRRYPVIASFADDDKSSQLESLASGGGPSGDVMEMMDIIQKEIYEKLRNIHKVEKDLNDNDINIWKLPRLIEATLLDLHVAVASMRHGVILEKVEKVKDDEFWKNIALGAVQLGLVLLAPVTEGLSLIPAAAISGYMLASHYDEYLKQSALAGTDFDRALAISGEEPSFFWLALDAVFFLADVGAALGAFRALQPLAAEVRAARTAEEAEQALRKLEQAATEQGGEQFARRVVSKAKLGEKVSHTERLFGESGRALEETTKAAEREAGQALLAKAVTATGDTVKVTKSGRLIVCSQPCRWLRDRFANVIGKDSALEERLTQLENRAAAAAAEADPALAKKLADDVANETSVLHRDLAYGEYVRAGGTATLDEFAKTERLRLEEFRNTVEGAKKRVTNAEESLRRARESAKQAETDIKNLQAELGYYKRETGKTSEALTAKRAEAELHEAEAAQRRLDPSLGDPAEAEKLAAEARAAAGKLETELQGAEELVAKTKGDIKVAAGKSKAAEKGVTTAEEQSRFITASSERQTKLAQQIDELETQFNNLPEVKARPGLYRYSPSPTAEAANLRRQIEALRQELRSEVGAAATNLYERLRKLSPGKEAKARAIANMKRLDKKLRGPNDHPIDVTNPGVEIKPGEISPDHVYSLKRITEDERFQRLSPRQQEQIVEEMKNYYPLTGAAQSSKSNRTMAEWFLTPEGSKIPPDIQKLLLDVETQAKDHIDNMINGFLAK